MPHRLPEYAAIEDYGVIGNCHTAALVSRYGSIDWWCPVRFDAPAVFAALLDPETGGRWWIGPAVDCDHERTHRAYVPDTNVLQTTFETATGVIRLTDLMPMRAGKGGMADGLEPRLAIIRMVECLEGEVAVEVAYEPRWDYGRLPAKLIDRGPAQGIVCERRADALMIRSEIELQVEGRRATGRELLAAGDRRMLALAFAEAEPLIVPPMHDGAAALVDDTIAWWRSWMRHFRYEGPYLDEVKRSALTLKLLCYAPSGAMIAAPTASLPEWIGGPRNWDYRYCWLRDASMTMRALLDLGFQAEGEALLNWMFTATQLTAPSVKVLYDVFGNTRLTERELDHLRGYRDSRPVRVGNEAVDQLQHDLYGEVLGGALAHAHRGGRIDGMKGRLLVGFGEKVCREWHRPDAGIWEIRGEDRHHTHSKVNCWRTLDALIELYEHGHVDAPADHFREVRDQIRADIEANGFDPEVGSYVAWYGGQAADAALLLLGLQGYCDPRSPRMEGTWTWLRSELATGALWHRYDVEAYGDGLTGPEGAFGICSFWAVEYLAKIGREDEAHAAFRELLGSANDLGLFAEEIHPETGGLLGNFPQGYTHVGLINAALQLAHQPYGSAEGA